MEYLSGAITKGGAAISGQGGAAGNSGTVDDGDRAALQGAAAGAGPGARRLQYIESRRLGEVTTTRRGLATKLGEGDATS